MDDGLVKKLSVADAFVSRFAEYFRMVWDAYVEAYGLGPERMFDNTINEGGKEVVTLRRRVSSNWRHVVNGKIFFFGPCLRHGPKVISKKPIPHQGVGWEWLLLSDVGISFFHFSSKVRHLRDQTKHEYAKWLGMESFFKEFYANSEVRRKLGKDKTDDVLVAPFEEEEEVREQIRVRCSRKGSYQDILTPGLVPQVILNALDDDAGAAGYQPMPDGMTFRFMRPGGHDQPG